MLSRSHRSNTDSSRCVSHANNTVACPPASSARACTLPRQLRLTCSMVESAFLSRMLWGFWPGSGVCRGDRLHSATRAIFPPRIQSPQHTVHTQQRGTRIIRQTCPGRQPDESQKSPRAAGAVYNLPNWKRAHSWRVRTCSTSQTMTRTCERLCALPQELHCKSDWPHHAEIDSLYPSRIEKRKQYSLVSWRGLGVEPRHDPRSARILTASTGL